MNNNDMLSNYPDVLLPQDIQNILKTGRNTTYQLLSSGKIHSVIIGGKYRIPKKCLIDFLARESTSAKQASRR